MHGLKRAEAAGNTAPPLLDCGFNSHRRHWTCDDLLLFTKGIGKNLVRSTPSHWGGIDRKASQMAALQNRNASYRIFFEYQRKQRVFTIGRVTEAEARAKGDQVGYGRSNPEPLALSVANCLR